MKDDKDDKNDIPMADWFWGKSDRDLLFVVVRNHDQMMALGLKPGAEKWDGSCHGRDELVCMVATIWSAHFGVDAAWFPWNETTVVLTHVKFRKSGDSEKESIRKYLSL